MTKHFDVKDFVSEVKTPSLATRKERLLYLAALVEKTENHVPLYHNLEHCSQELLDRSPAAAIPGSVFALAADDPHLKAAGVGDMIGKQMKFFELDKAELHEFSCDCGGSISNKQMASRITALGSETPTNLNPGAGLLGRMAFSLRQAFA